MGVNISGSGILSGLASLVMGAVNNLNLLITRIIGYTTTSGSGSGYYGSSSVTTLAPGVMFVDGFTSQFTKFFTDSDTVVTGTVDHKKTYYTDTRTYDGGYHPFFNETHFARIAHGVLYYSTDGQNWNTKVVNPYVTNAGDYDIISEGVVYNPENGRFAMWSGPFVALGNNPGTAIWQEYTLSNGNNQVTWQKPEWHGTRAMFPGRGGVLILSTMMSAIYADFNVFANTKIRFNGDEPNGIYYVSFPGSTIGPKVSNNNGTDWHNVTLPVAPTVNSPYQFDVSVSGEMFFYLGSGQGEDRNLYFRSNQEGFNDNQESWQSMNEFFGFSPSPNQPLLDFVNIIRFPVSSSLSVSQALFIGLSDMSDTYQQFVRWTNNTSYSAVSVEKVRFIEEYTPRFSTILYHGFLDSQSINGSQVYSTKTYAIDLSVLTIENITNFLPTLSSVRKIIENKADNKLYFITYQFDQSGNIIRNEYFSTTSPFLYTIKFISSGDDTTSILPANLLANTIEVQASIGNQTPENIEVLAPVDVYTVPSNKYTTLNQISVKNNSASQITVDIWILPSSATPSDNNALINDQVVAPGQTYSLSGLSSQLQPTNKIVVLPSSVDVAEVKVYGTEYNI